MHHQSPAIAPLSYAAYSETYVPRRCVWRRDRKSTRLNSSHDQISYAVFCLKKKKRSKLRTVVKRHRANVLMLVGHEPDFTNVITGLTGASLNISTAGVALVDVDPESEEANR